MYSFIEPNNKNKEIDVLNKQGKQLLNYNKKYLKNINISRILETCDKTVCSVRETMDQKDSANQNVSFNELLQEIKEKENNYNRKLKEYTDLQKSLNEQMIKNNRFYTKNKDFLGKTIVNHETNYYVNSFGYTHKYSHDAWDNDNESCPSTAIDVKSKELGEFKRSIDMNTGQPCNVAGQIIENNTSGDHAWVDLKGTKHIFASDVWDVKHKTCKIDVKKLSDKDFNSIPQGSNMTKTSLCLKQDINPGDYLQLKKINEELISLAKDISKSMNQVISKDTKINNKINLKKHKLENYLKDLDNNREKINKYNQSIKTISAQEEDTSKEYTAQYYMYISWTLVAILIGSITLKTLSK